MAKVENILIPAKFISIMFHLVVVTMVFFSYPDNIKQSYPYLNSKQDILYTSARGSILACLVLSIILLVIELIIHFEGNNLFREVHNVIMITFHLLGIIFEASYIFQLWNFYNIWYIFIVFNLLPFLIQCFTTISSNFKYRKWN